MSNVKEKISFFISIWIICYLLRVLLAVLFSDFLCQMCHPLEDQHEALAAESEQFSVRLDPELSDGVSGGGKDGQHHLLLSDLQQQNPTGMCAHVTAEPDSAPVSLLNLQTSHQLRAWSLTMTGQPAEEVLAS